MKPKPLFPVAHVVTVLSTRAPAQHALDEWHEPHGALQSVTSVLQFGNTFVHQHARMGGAGLQLLRHDGVKMIAVCVPLETLFAFAAQINPAFSAAPDKPLAAADATALAESGAK